MIRSIQHVFVACGVVLLCSAAAEAQTCVGAPSFNGAPYQLGLRGAFADGRQGVGAGLTVGSNSGLGLFGGLAAAVQRFNDLDANQTSLFASGGSESQLQRDRRVFICPNASLGFGWGPNVGATDITAVNLRGGGDVGFIASDNGMLAAVPTFGLSVAWQRTTASAGDEERSVSDTYWIARLGVGFIFDSHMAVIPALSIPFAVPDSDPAFTIDFAFSFGR